MTSLSRRDALLRGLALGAITTVTSGSAYALLEAFEEKQRRAATPHDDLGPFYKKRAPETSSLRIAGDPGMPLKVNGAVFDTRGDSLGNAVLEIWHSDHLGHYDLTGYRYRAQLHSDGKGGYAFDSIMPGHYPDRVCQHIHYLVTAPGHKPLVTQLYFASDPVFEGDPAKNFHRDPLITSVELVRPVVLAGDPKTIEAAVRFDVVLEAL